MRVNRKYLVAVALLAVLAVVFGLAGTVMPVADVVPPQQFSSSSDGVAHFQNPPTYDSGWQDITGKAGQYIPVVHGLNTTEVVVDITGKQSLNATGGDLEWSRTYGGADLDQAHSVVQTSDGGYAIAGSTDSYDVGGRDFWLVKTDSAGNMEWSEAYGGADQENAWSMVQTSDDGYIIAGDTKSYGSGGRDFWLVKTDSVGNMEWNKTYGGTSNERAYSVVQTSDGGYAIAGLGYSPGSSSQFWLVKTDADGNVHWNQMYGGASLDNVRSLVQTRDGGYALAGYTLTDPGNYDFWLVKTDSVGSEEWNATFGGTRDDMAFSVVETFDGGYAIAGLTDSYDVGGGDFWLVKTDAHGSMQWDQTYGGGSLDWAESVVQTFDGGFAMAGFTGSYGAGDDDFWLVKTNSTGHIEWNQTYGGTGLEQADSLFQTSEGGCAIAGYTESFGAGNFDFWLVKVNGEMYLEHQRNIGGTSIVPGWSRTYGGTSDDSAFCVIQTYDGGYAIAGTTRSFGATNDFYLVKTDSVGSMEWNKTYGGTDDEDYGRSLVQTSDGGYAIAGIKLLGEGPGSNDDFYLVKTDSIGDMEWNKTYGRTLWDEAHSVIQTSDGGYAIAGNSRLVGPGYFDCWLVKVDSTGEPQWNKTYGGTDDEDYGRSLVQTSDGGYAIAGYTVPYPVGDSDFYLVKTDPVGDMEWNKTYGGTENDNAHSLVQTGDGGYAIAGTTNSYGAGGVDSWLIKTDSSGNVQLNQTYGGTDHDWAYSVVETSDGGYAMAGSTYSYGPGDLWLVKTDSSGDMKWKKTYGGTGPDEARSVVETSDGGYAMAGVTYSYGAGIFDFWLVKTDVEIGLALTRLTDYTVTLYRGKTDPYWNYVRIRIWLIKEPTWQFGDITGPEGVPDGKVDIYDLALVGKNYGKIFSLLSLGGIGIIASIHTYKTKNT